MNAGFKIVLCMSLVAAISSSASAQTNDPFSNFKIGPSKTEVIAVAVGVGAVSTLVLYAVLHKPSITGCVQSVDGISSLTDQDNLTYTLVNEPSALKPGNRVKLSGRKKKEKSGKLMFRVSKLKQDYGTCQP